MLEPERYPFRCHAPLIPLQLPVLKNVGRPPVGVGAGGGTSPTAWRRRTCALTGGQAGVWARDAAAKPSVGTMYLWLRSVSDNASADAQVLFIFIAR